MIMIGTMTFAADCAMAVAENLGRIASVPDFTKLDSPVTFKEKVVQSLLITELVEAGHA